MGMQCSVVRRLRFVLLVALAAVVVPGQPATASCAADAGPDGSPVVFAGTAEVERRGYTRFEVAEVWEGPDLAPTVWVRSGQDQPPWPLSLFMSVGSSEDADFVTGHRYVVGAGEAFDTSDCTVAAVDDVTPPADVRRPVEGGNEGADPPIDVLGVSFVMVGVLAGAGLIAWLVGIRRRVTSAG